MVRVWFAAAVVALMGTAVVAHAQDASTWQGEWGAFTGAQDGRRLSIHDCAGATCKFSIEVRSSAGHAETMPQGLTMQSATEAIAALPGENKDVVCTLQFKRQAGAIAVAASGGGCTSYYATSPEVTMSGTYPFRDARNYGGLHADECFLGVSEARMATCTRRGLAALEQKWQELAEQYPLQASRAKGQSAYELMVEMDDAILAECDRDADAAQCLTARYTTQIAAMQAKKDAYIAGTVERGDPGEGGRIAAKIAGEYRHSFANADVQGDRYTSTNRLTIRPVGAASIHFDVELNFYNGHECSLAGGALYRKDGNFVFDDAPEIRPANAPACRLAIVPTANGVKFEDITGGCKLTYCGERGSFSGEGFTFGERIRGPEPEAKSAR